jgi:hypothetical protein
LKEIRNRWVRGSNVREILPLLLAESISPGAKELLKEERVGVEAIYGLIDVLQPFAITGWHCTRLTDAEMDHILRAGMQLPDTAMLNRRIDALVTSGDIAPDIARRLKAENQSRDARQSGSALT